MFDIFRRAKDETFNIAAIGENWLVRPLTHDGVPGRLHVRQLPATVARRKFKFVALAQTREPVQASDIPALTNKVKTTLERGGSCLLVLAHEVSGQVTWYAYAATRKALHDAFTTLGDSSIGWAADEDKDWLEYEHAKNLVGA
jgi:hypothetical protein